MSDLQPSAIPLINGLDLTTPKVIAPPGSMIDCLNYELVDFSGYKSIDGYERYDGQASPSIVELYSLRTANSIAAYSVGDVLLGNKHSPYTPIQLSADDLQGAFGVVVKKTTSVFGGNALYFAKLNDTYLPAADDTCERLNLTTGAGANSITVDSIELIIDEKQQDWDLAYQEVLDAQEVLRGLVGQLPGQPIGLHWFRDRLYSICGVTKLYVVPTANGSTPSTGNKGTLVTPELNQTITAANGASGIVTRVQDRGYAPASVDGSFSSLEVVEINIIDLYTGSWEDAHIGAEVNWDTSTTTGLVHTVSADEHFATLYVAKDINQTIDEDTAPLSFGWKNIHQGWRIECINGNAAAGYLDKEEQSSNAATTGTTYWFYDGAVKFSATLNSYYVDSGDLTAGTAVLQLQVSDLTLVSGSGYMIDNTFDMYSDLACLTKVADVNTDMYYNALRGLTDIVAYNSRYQFLSANFYGAAALDAMYGVNSAGRAFYYNGTFFAKIWTQADGNLDRPRHIENHVGHLALGFESGSLQLSVVGDPWDFSGLNGATEIACGSPVRGLASVNGDTLIIFCDDDIKSLSGQVIDEFQQKIIVPKAGFIEYSLISMGRPIYCTNWGISSIEQSDRYGDFQGSRLSQTINTWLLPKLIDKDSGRYGSAGVLCAIPVRSKNQYRLFLKDGTIVTMTLNDESAPGFTTQRWSRVEDRFAYIKPLCTSSQVDNFGKERIHFATWEQETVVPEYRITEDEDFRISQLRDYRVTQLTVLTAQNGSNYVYEGDIGWSFDGELIHGYFETNWYFGDRPTYNLTTAGVRLHGLVQGKASLSMYAAGVEDDYDRFYHAREQPINLDRKVTQKYLQEYRPVTNIVDLATRGMGIQYLVERTNTVNEPPHVVQVMTVYTRPSGKPDTP